MRTSGELWDYFYRGEKQNKSHYKAYCYGCIKHHAPDYIKHQSNLDLTTLNGENWFPQGLHILTINEMSYQYSNKTIACQTAGSVLGEKTAMIAHILGGKQACQYASSDGKKKRLRLCEMRARRKSQDLSIQEMMILRKMGHTKDRCWSVLRWYRLD